MLFHQLGESDDAHQYIDSLDAFCPGQDGLYSLKLLDELRTKNNNNNYDRPSSPTSTMEDIEGTSFNNFMFGGEYSETENECQQHFIPLPLLGEQNRTKPKLPNPNPKRVKTQHCDIRGRDEVVKQFQHHCKITGVTPSSIYDERIDLPPFMSSLTNYPNILKVYEAASELPHPSNNDVQNKRDGRDADNTSMPTTDTHYSFGEFADLNDVIIVGKGTTRIENDGSIYIIELLLRYGKGFKDGSTYDEKVPLLDKILEEIKRDGYRIVEMKKVQGTGRKVGKQTRGQHYKLNPHPKQREYLFHKLYRIEEQGEYQKARNKLADLRKKRIAKSITEVEKAIPMFGEGKSLIHSQYTPGYETEEFINTGKAPSNVTEDELKLFAREKKLALAREQLKRKSLPHIHNNTKMVDHLPNAWILAAYADLFEFLLGLDSSASRKPLCTLDQLRDVVETHTGLELSKLTHKGNHLTYEERWSNEWYTMLTDVTYGLTIRLGSGESGKDWKDVWNHEHDHITSLYIKDKGVGQIRQQADTGVQKCIFRMLVETFKCKVEDVGDHERGSHDNHATKLLYNPQLTYDFSQAGCKSAEQFFEKKEIQSLLVDLASRHITTYKGEFDAEPRASFESLEAIVYFHTRMLLGDVHPNTADEYKAKLGQRRRFVNQLILYLFKSVSLNLNPRGEKFWDVIPIRKSGIDIHHPINVKYDVGPSALINHPIEFMISELKRGRCIALWRADHIVITMFEKSIVNDIPQWMKDISRS